MVNTVIGRQMAGIAIAIMITLAGAAADPIFGHGVCGSVGLGLGCLVGAYISRRHGVMLGVVIGASKTLGTAIILSAVGTAAGMPGANALPLSLVYALSLNVPLSAAGGYLGQLLATRRITTNPG